ncbi:hypothetical protein F4679DRAFT_580580 [Xylaria curta]|nr:hypothetical protein F4679DRAFT_580580 [Xylaria curta]
MSQIEQYKPDKQEKDGYFYGLAGRPRLVARTSTSRWTEPQYIGGWNETPFKTRKEYLPVIENEVLSRWNNDLSYAIIEALGGCSWNYFFPIRIGFEYTGQVRPESHIVLLVAVDKDSLQWEDGITIALECRDILRKFGISDVEVEIREGRYEHHAASEHFETQIDTEGWCSGQTNEAVLPMLSSLGYPIGYLEDLKGQGTVGLHLKLSRDETSATFYGLTCRHVVSRGRHIHESYKFSGEQRQYHVQANHTGFSDCSQELERIQLGLEKSMEPLLAAKDKWEQWYMYDETKKNRCPTEEDEKHLLELQVEVAYNAKIIENLAKIKEKNEREIGHLAYHSNLQISSLRPGYLKDWALIELNPDKFVNGPENKVFIGSRPELTHISKRILENGFLSLVLGDEVEALGRHGIVGKRGSRTGLTFGTKSGIEAVIRHPSADGEDVYAWEMLIVPEPKYEKFSDRGDSGAAIFDSRGRVIGLVTGSTDARPEDDWRGVCEYGTSNSRKKRYPGGYTYPEDADNTAKDDLAKLPNGVDITFAAPIQWVLEDIQDFTGLQARLA